MSKALDAQLKAVTASATVVAVFHNNLMNCRATFKSGKDAIFLNGVYTTSNEEEIKELNAEIDAGHPHIYAKEDELTKDTKYVDPTAAIRAQLLKELKEQGVLINAGESDYGNSDQIMKLNVGTTRDVSDAMSGSTSVEGGAASVVVSNASGIGGQAGAAAQPVSMNPARVITPGTIAAKA
jgi:hypothetical protein